VFDDVLFLPFVTNLAGVMVIMLAIGSKGRGFKPGRDDEFLRTINIRSSTSFGEEVKPSAPCFKILRNVKKYFYV
jgi:hypothetical protein